MSRWCVVGVLLIAVQHQQKYHHAKSSSRDFQTGDAFKVHITVQRVVICECDLAFAVPLLYACVSMSVGSGTFLYAFVCCSLKAPAGVRPPSHKRSGCDRNIYDTVLPRAMHGSIYDCLASILV